MSQARKDRSSGHLSGWRAIAEYFQRDPSTVRRWAADHDLPVYRAARPEGRQGATVFAYPEELDAWLRRFGDRPVAAGADGQGPAEAALGGAEEGGTLVAWPQASVRADGWGPRIPRRTLAAVLPLVALLLVLGLLLWPERGGVPAMTVPHEPTEQVRRLYADGVYHAERRTPQSLAQAAALLEQATVADPAFAEAWSALATTYNLMVEYFVVGAGAGYDLSEAAALQALAIDSDLAAPNTVLADIAFFWRRDAAAGIARFERAIVLDPTDAQTRHWYASALALSGEPRRALAEIERARYLDPVSRSIRVTEAIVLLSAGQAALAETRLEDLVAADSAYRNPYRFLAFARLAQDDLPGYLDAWRIRFELTGDASGKAIIARGIAAFETSGRLAMQSAMAEAALLHANAREAAGVVEPYFLAHVLALSGDAEAAAAALASVQTRHAFYQAIDPAFVALHGDPGFRAALAGMDLPAL